MDSASETIIDLRPDVDLTDSLEQIAARVVQRYLAVRRTVDSSGNLFARFELQSALIEVRRVRRRITVAESQDLTTVDVSQRR